MSNSKNAIQEIKRLMVQFGFMTEETPLQSFKTIDQTILQTESLKVGNSIKKISEEFEQIALEDGSYRLKDNFDIEVKDGKIESVKEIFLDAKLVDGTAIKVEGDSLVEGAKVVVVQEDAEVPAPDGVHELEDGSKVETKDGVIVGVQEKVEEVEKPEVEISVEAEKPLEPSLAMEKEVMEMVKDFVVKMGEKISKMEQDYAKLENEFNSFKKEPAAPKIAKGKTEVFNKTEDVVEAKLAAISALRKTNK